MKDSECHRTPGRRPRLTLSSFVTQPNMYARGILFGKMKYELGDNAVVRCPETGLEANIEFKVKGWVSGTYNQIGGHISDRNGKHLYELSGFWNGEMFIKNLATGQKDLLFDATHARPSAIQVRPMEEQGARESHKLWDSTTRAIKKADQKTATDEKSRIEDEQRREAAERGEGHVWKPKLFRAAPPGDEENLDWIIDAEVDGSAPAKTQIEQVLAIAPIIPGQVASDASTDNHKAAAPPAASSVPAAVTGDLLNLGDHQKDGSAAPAPATAPKSAAPPPNGALQEPLQPTTASRPGDPVRRMDSMGNEETFIDAED